MFSKIGTEKSMSGYSDNIERLKENIANADAVVIGAGAGLSASAGFTYSGERFQKLFGDFAEKYSITDMYSGGFYPFDTLEEYWAWWSRHIYYNRYIDAPKPVYKNLFKLLEDKDYFVLTTNVDHQFQRAGFEQKRLFYTQGDYGLFQCSEPCCQKTYDNEAIIRQMVEQQTNLRVPDVLVPRCPVCGKPMTVNLRADSTFVEDEGWHLAAERYAQFLRRHENCAVLYLELGVGSNTPGIIKYPFWRMTAQNQKASYACINLGEALAPQEIERRAICIDGDIDAVISELSFTDEGSF